MKVGSGNVAYSRNGSCYQVSGEVGAPTVVFIHGLGLNQQIWSPYRTQFASRYRVLSYDLYGHGASAPPPARPSLSLFAEQLLDLLDELGVERAALLGFSLGGMINRRLAIDHPSRVSALVILNSPHERDPAAQQLVEERALVSAAGGPAATLDATIERWFTPAFRQRQGEFIESVRNCVLANDADVYTLCRQVLAFGVVELIRPEPPIQQAALVITCEHDSGSTPAMSRAIASEIQAARVIIVPGLQHMGLCENPSLFSSAILEFLDDVATH